MVWLEHYVHCGNGRIGKLNTWEAVYISMGSSLSARSGIHEYKEWCT